MPQSSQSRLDAQTATAPPVRPDDPEEPWFLDQVANACRVKHLAYRNLQVVTSTWAVLPKGGTGPGTERSPEWLVADRSGQVVSRQPVQHGPEPAVRPVPRHFPVGTDGVPGGAGWVQRRERGKVLQLERRISASPTTNCKE
jgi:hypothetical protein